MAALEIVSLAIESADTLRTVLLSARQRCEDYSDIHNVFDDLLGGLVRNTATLRKFEQRMNSRPREDHSGLVDRQLMVVNKTLCASIKIVEKLGNDSSQVRSGPLFMCMFSRITDESRIHGKLNKVASNVGRVDALLDTVASLLSISEHPRAQGSRRRVNRHVRVPNVPILTHRDVLDFDGKDENGNLTAEAQLKVNVLDKRSRKVGAAAGDASSRPHSKVSSAHGMAGVGKTVALKGLGWDEQVREAFEEIHYITLRHDATANTVISELAHIVEVSGGERESSTVRRCKDVKGAVSHASRWFSDRKCLFLVDDVWKSDQSSYGYLPALMQLLSSCEGSRMAITTRDRNIASQAGQGVEFRPREIATSRKIFLGYFGADTSETLMLCRSGAESLDKLLDLCGGIPLAHGIAGLGARALKDEGWNAARALDEYANRLEGQRSNLLENTLPSYGRDDESQTLQAAIETSLEFLDRRDQSASTSCEIGIRKMYRALGVLKAQAWAPVSMLSKLWNVGRKDAERIMGQLCIMSLAEAEHRTYEVLQSSEKRAERGLKMHNLQIEYCRQNGEGMDRLHCRLLNEYLEAAVQETKSKWLVDEDARRQGAEEAIIGVKPRPWWSESMAEDGYIHENVAWHLARAGKRDELRGLLLDAQWIRLRFVIGGIFALENDFAELVGKEGIGIVDAEGSGTESSDSEFRVILNALRCSWEHLVQNERELAVQLGGRLFDAQESSAAVRTLLKSAIRNSEKPFAEARYGFLPASSGQVNEVHLGGLCNSLSYSVCGKYIAATAGKDVVVVESDTLAKKLRFSGHTRHVSSVCFLSDSCKIVSGSEDGTVRLWDLSKPGDDAITLERQHDSPVTSVCASADGSRVASGSTDGTIQFWSLIGAASKGEERKRRSKWMSWLQSSVDDPSDAEDMDIAAYGLEGLRGQTAEISSVCFSPDGALLASASGDGTMRLWNGHTGAHTGITVKVHEGKVLCVAFSPDGERIASGSDDGTIRLWRADTGASNGIVIAGHSSWANSIAFSADGARIVSASDDKTVRVWSAETGAAIGATLKGHTNLVTSVAFSPDGVRVASVSTDGTLRIWEPEKARGVSAAREVHSGLMTCSAFSADGSRIAVGFDDGAICMWDTQSGRAVGRPLEGHTAKVKCLAFSKDGALLASGSSDKTVRLWDVPTGAALSDALEGHNSWVYSVSFSADGDLLYSVGGSRCLWSVSSGTRLWISQRSSEDVANAISDAEAQAAVEAIDQRRAAASNDGAVVYYDAKDGAVKMRHNEANICLASLPPVDQYASGTFWMHISDRSEFAAVLSDGTPVCLKLHL